jgi:GTP:adenosylcobinamide-phosphate guanylyltransferase
MGVPAIVTAGDSRAAKAVYGKSKVYLEIDGLPLVAHVVRTLQDCPEIDSVWVVGNVERLDQALGGEEFRSGLRKPLHVVPQQRDLLANCWETYRRILSGDVREGRDPLPDTPEELDREVLYLSGDLPLATAQEISSFVQQSQAANVDYVLGLCPAESLDPFRPQAPGEAGISVAYFNVRDGRFRQSNLHYARPARIGRRQYIEEMYELRHQRRFWNMLVLTSRLLFSRMGGLKVALLLSVMHIAGLADRSGRSRLARVLSRLVTLENNREAISRILDTRFRFAITEAGGCALDVDTEEEYDAMTLGYAGWIAAQRSRAEALYGPLPDALPEKLEGASEGVS